MLVNMFFSNVLSLTLFSSLAFAATVFYERPSMARLSAFHQPAPVGCIYQNKKYPHGEKVVTSEPCLNCTCKKGVLLCFLRVCPALVPQSTSRDCQTVREPGQCCPVVKCPSTSTTFDPNIEEVETTTTLTTTDRLSEEDELNITTEASVEKWNSEVPSVPSVTPSSETGDQTTALQTKSQGKVTITMKDGTTVFQTNPTTVFHESPKLVTSSPQGFTTTEQSDLTEINTINGGCYINGSHYAEGSAVMSSSFCEYCYCIRSKRMCIRPRCHLSILGCMPRYTSEYACCPTSYVCGQNAISAAVKESAFTTTTTLRPITNANVRKVCREENAVYQIGDSIPSNVSCQNCYCSFGGIKKCKKIKCSPVMNGCTPIIPEGHCCPVEYKCDSSQRLRSETKFEDSDARRMLQTTTDSIELKTETETASNEGNRETTESVAINNLPEKNNSNAEFTTVTASREKANISLNNNDAKPTTAAVIIEGFRNETIENASVSEEELRLTLNATSQDWKRNESKQSMNDSKIEEENSLWRSDFESKTNVTHRDRVEEILDGIIHALDKRLQSSLPAEPRLPLKKITEFFSSMTSKDSQQALKRAEIQPVYTPNETTYVQASPYIPLNKYYSTSRSQESDDGYKETFEIDPHTEYRRGSVLEDEPKVEIITAGTPLVHNSPNDDSILVNLSPASFKVGSVLPEDSGNSNHETNKPIYNNHQSSDKPQLLSFPVHYTDEYKSSKSQSRPESDWHTLSSLNQDLPKESLYYHGNTNEELNKSTVSTLDKKARLDVSEEAEFSLTSFGNRMKYTPFGAHDATLSYHENTAHKKNGSQLIRMPTNRNPSRPLNKPIPLSTSCVVDKLEFTNGVMITKSDPCLLCHCFYGRELCQQKKCPTAPRPDCIPEFISGFCCPRFTCRISGEPQNDMKQPLESGYLPFRKGPQYPVTNQVTTKAPPSLTTAGHSGNDKVTEMTRPENYNVFITSNKEQTIKEMLMQPVPGFPSVPANVHSVQNKRPPFPLDPTPRPYVQQLFGFVNHGNNNKQPNRVHFPAEKVPESKDPSDSIAVQPPKSESVAALVPPIPQATAAGNRQPIQAVTPSTGYINRLPQPYAPTPQRQNWKIPAHFSGPNVHQQSNATNNSNSEVRPNTHLNNSSLSKENVKVESDVNKHEEMKPAETIDVKHSTVNSTLPTTAKLTTKRLVTSTTTTSTTEAVVSEPVVTPEKSTHSSSISNHWDLLRVSGCNIYGTFYKVDQVIVELSSTCKRCFCSTFGVQCDKTC